MCSRKVVRKNKISQALSIVVDDHIKSLTLPKHQIVTILYNVQMKMYVVFRNFHLEYLLSVCLCYNDKIRKMQVYLKFCLKFLLE